MKKAVLTLLAVIVLLAIPSLTAFAQEYPKYEFFGGFSWERAGGATGTGWNVSGAGNLNNYLGIAVDVSGLNSSPSEESGGYVYNADVRQYMFLAGPQVKSRDSSSRVAPYLHLLMGVAHSSTDFDLTQNGALLESGSDKGNAFAITLGGGFDYKIKGPVALRIIQINYMGVRSSGFWAKGWRFSHGLVLNLGKKND